MANIKDVARYANVSVTTVSHVLNDRGRVSPKTRQRVLDAAEQLGYTANAHAQQLVTRRSRILVIQMPDLDGASGHGVALVPTSESEYFLELVNGAAAAAAEAKYALIVVSSGVDVASMRGFGIDGMIIVDPKGSEPVLQTSFAGAYPVVTTGEPVIATGAPGFVVDNDHRAAAREVLDHFVDQGCARPALIVDTTSRSYIRDIVEAYGQWCAARSVRPAVVAVPDASASEMAAALESLRSGPEPADAVYTSSDGCAVALLNAARTAGVSVPGDLALASAVDSSILRVTNPPVTAVYLHPRDIGAQAIECVTELIARTEPGNDLPPLDTSRLLIPTRVALRESTTTDPPTTTGSTA
ncbi:LacI family DNA-binding transcriptional regulator [Mycolicibacterium sp. S2-37]|uniref:LacI family DNA-binding transcriptional regulator n=1 Tax=Mycolicibacterium sp. S2-37 TaxID=2810297 RepID=UPI001A93C417|nr:LacI family DNA-binding transcriptional regulator [Mycolicibacterium sp. S2-37]MBO0679036.1 LacI family DNA-binding transcriptional regulator [Mycolicibacterium sp. S2-37]